MYGVPYSQRLLRQQMLQHYMKEALVTSQDADPDSAGKEVLGASADLLLHDDHATAHARALVRAVLASWGVGDDAAFDALLVVSELVGNAALHSSHHAAHLDVTLNPLGLLVAVRDGSEVVPAPRPVTPLDESGRGYMIIEGLALSWGVEDEPDGKRVWALLPDPRREGGAARLTADFPAPAQ
jgi:anti-sigma regulatory factor (Ser/Thr protein kinase)